MIHRHLYIALLFSLLSALAAQGADPNGLVRLAVAPLRAQATHSSEMETQALMGTPVRLLETDGDWTRCELPDGYVAYIHNTAVVATDSAVMTQWRVSPRLICTSAYETHVFSRPDAASLPVSDFSLGCIAEGVKSDSAFTAVILPDGRAGWVETAAVEPFESHMKRPFDPERVIQLADALTGSSYLWGGRSVKGVDCSGLTQLCYFDCGILLPRNASAQALAGERVDEPERGDLLFFENEEGRVTHVAIYDAASIYIHSSGLVHRSSMDPSHPLYNGRRVTSVMRPGRVNPVTEHPWYF